MVMSLRTTQYHLPAALTGPSIHHHDPHVEAADKDRRYQLEDHLQHDLVDPIEERLLVDGVVPTEIDVHVAGAQHALD